MSTSAPAGSPSAGPETATGPEHPARVVVDLDAVAANAGTLSARAAREGAAMMAVVKADAYGHGLVPCARAALAGGATWLGVAQASEALELRRAGVTAPLLTWLYSPTSDLTSVLAADIDLSVAGEHALAQVVAAARLVGVRARVHIKVDTGLGRNGVPPLLWESLFAQAREQERAGTIEVVGIWSHFAWADAPEHPTVVGQQVVFEESVAAARAAGLDPSLRHLANSAATLTNPSMYYDMVRPGLAVYGLSPVPHLGSAAHFGLRPAMRVSSRLALVKPMPAGHGVSYAHAYTTPADTTLALVPLGYADGIPRAGSSVAPVQVGGVRGVVAGRVCMDQFVVDVGADAVLDITDPGCEAVLFGSGEAGEPTAEDWAQACGTISYEIVTRIAPHLPRTYVGEHAAQWTRGVAP